MNLENIVKYHFAKSTLISDSPRATASDSLTGTDIMAALGMVQAKAPMGFDLFLAKMGIQDPAPAIDALVHYALALNNPTLNKLNDKTKSEVVQCLVQFAYTDYSRSAASKSVCEHCRGEGVRRSLQDVVKHPGVRGVEPKVRQELVEALCEHCNGKGEVSTACRGCKGKGIVLDVKRTKLHGVPVQKICGRCNGHRFSRVPTSLARAVMERLVPDLTKHQWYSGYAEVIDKLVTKCWQEEAYAEKLLRKVTR